MRLFFLVIAIHFISGALGILLINSRLTLEKRKKNWLKYAFYLFIFIVVLVSALLNKNIFLAIGIIISSVSLLELLRISKLPCRNYHRARIVFISLSIFLAAAFFFSIFVLLPSVIILFTYTLVVIFDGASQIIGQVIGKRKILPVLSPDKTWEGFIGGILSVCITAVILHDFAGFSILQSSIFGLLVCMASFMGDLAASAFKRAFDVKDFGNILPGQGGMLDRFDSFLAAGAITGVITIPSFFELIASNINIAVYLGYSIVFVTIILAGELIHYLSEIKAEYSRIFSHLFAGIVSLFMIRLFTSHWYIISLCIQSAIFLHVSKKMRLLESHHEVARNTNGSSIFFLGILAAYLISEIRNDILLFILPVTILTISDPIASVIGLNRKSGFLYRLPSGTGSSKTYPGSLGFFISTTIIIFAGLCFFYTLTYPALIVISVVISLLTTIAEALCPGGTDNLSIPLVAGVSLAFVIG